MLIDTTDTLKSPGESRVTNASLCLETVGEGLGRVEFEPMDARVTLTGTEDGAVALVQVEGKARAFCDRCLRTILWPMSVQHTLEIRETPEGNGEEHEDVLIADSQGQVDLAPTLQEIVLVSLPMKLLCDADCRGLCPRCGRDLNQGECGCKVNSADPRLAVLETLRDRLGGGSDT